MPALDHTSRLAASSGRAAALLILGSGLVGAVGLPAHRQDGPPKNSTAIVAREGAIIERDSTPQPPIVYPGAASLRADRISDGTDTLTLLVTPPNGAERTAAVLVRAIRHMNIAGVAIVRETQHYSSMDGGGSYDTLDVNASTLAPVRYFSSSSKNAMDVHIDGPHVEGWQTDSLGVRSEVHVDSPHPFFVSMMSESFIAALPLGDGAAITLPTANPPLPAVSATVLRATTVDTLKTTGGIVPCTVVVGPGHAKFWVSRADGHLVRLSWTLPDGTTVWKLPSRDVKLR
jgi:hypothetical protein